MEQLWQSESTLASRVTEEKQPISGLYHLNEKLTAKESLTIWFHIKWKFLSIKKDVKNLTETFFRHSSQDFWENAEHAKKQTKPKYTEIIYYFLFHKVKHLS